jgi:hypothetical protein
MELTTCERAPRIHMGGIAEPPSSGGARYVMAPARMARDPARQLARVVPLLESNSLRMRDSPYADEGGALASFCADVLRGAPDGDLAEAIERVIDTRPFFDAESEKAFPRLRPNPHDLRFDSSFIAPDVVPTAGIILSQERRMAYDGISRSRFFTISQVMESYLLAASVMRAAGFRAFPATAVTPGEAGEEHKPLVAVIDASKPPQEAIITFDLIRREHPPVGSLEIISDKALWGMANAMRAQNRVKLLMSEVSMIGLSGSVIGPGELSQRIEDIAMCLFECHRSWPGSHFVSEALAFLRDEMYLTAKFLSQRSIEQNWQEFASENPELARSPALLEQAVAGKCAGEGLMAERMALDSLARLIERSGGPDLSVN